MFNISNIKLESIQSIGTLLDYLGAVTILIGIAFSTFILIRHWYKHFSGAKLYDSYRKDLARSILLGLEFIVAGDIIRTISGTISITSVVALAGIVLIRSFLGAEFELELTGRWPWQRNKKPKRKNRSKKK